MQREGQAHSPTKSEWDSADAKPTERSYGKSVGGFGRVGWARVANDKNIKKRSQHITVTAFIDYCFV